MSVQTVLTILGSLGIPVIVTALFKFFETRKTLRTGEPKTNAEALDIGITSQRRVIETLEAENARLSAKVLAAEALADARELRHEARVNALSAQVEAVRHDWTHERELQRVETHAFKRAIAALLIENNIPLPYWWHTPLDAPTNRPQGPAQTSSSRPNTPE